jgi:hypothetical protein
MAGNRNRPSMGMNFHEEHLRNLNYGVTGMKIGTTTASTLGPDLVEETRNTETASLRFSKSAGSGYSAHRRASSPYRDEDMHYSDVGYINSGHTGRVDASAQSNGRHASGNYRRAARGTTDPGGAYRRHASDQMSNRYHNMQFDNTDPSGVHRRNSYQMAERNRRNDDEQRYNNVPAGLNRRVTDPPRSNIYAPKSHRHTRTGSLCSSGISTSSISNISGSFNQKKKSQVQYNTMSSPAPMNNPRFANEDINMRSSPFQYQDFDDDASRCTRTQALHPSATNRAKDMTYPQGDVTIIFTDVQGSTSL